MKVVSSSFNKGEDSISSLSQKNEILTKKLTEQNKALSEAKNMLDKAKNSTEANETTILKWQNAVNKAQAEVNKTTKELKENEDTMQELKYANVETTTELKKLDKSLDDVADSSEKASGGFTVMKGALSNLVAEGFKKAIDGAKEFASSMIDVSAEVKAENSQFKQTFGEMGDVATESIGRVANSAGILETRLNSTASSIYAFARSSGATSEEAMELMEASLMATADASAYYDKSLEETAETLQSFLKGNFANDAQLGVSATEFTRNAKATELFGKKYNELTEIQKQKTLLTMVTDAQKLSGAMGQASREADGWENVQGNLNEAWRQFQANVGTPFLEALIPVIQEVTAGFKAWSESVDWEAFGTKVSGIAEAIKVGFGWLVENSSLIISGITGIATAMMALNVYNMIMNVVKAFQAWKLANEGLTISQMLLNTIMSLNPIGLIIAGIAGLVAGIIALWHTNDGFREAVISAWNMIKEVFSKVWDAITLFFTKTLPKVLNDAIKFFEGIPKWFNELPSRLGYALGYALGTIIKWGVNVFNWVKTEVPKIINNIGNFFSQLPSKVWNWLLNTINKVVSFGTSLFQKGKEAGNKLVTSFTDTIKSLPENMLNIGKNIVQGLWNGISNSTQWIKDKVKGFANGILGGIKSALGIHSPSKVFEEQVGKNMALGLGEGFTNSMGSITKDMQKSIPTEFDTNATLNGIKSNNPSTSNNYANMVGAFKEALGQMKIILDDEVAGRFIENTVTDLLYT